MSLFKICLFFIPSLLLAEVRVVKDLSYRVGATDTYQQERCKLDLYLSAKKGKAPVLIWFHGGGLKSNDKEKEDEVVLVAKHFQKRGVAFVAVNYRLSPKVFYPEYVSDAAVSIKWIIEHAEEYDLDKNKIFVGGHSAGGYLALMSTFNNEFTKKCQLNISDIAGIIPISGQTMTHNTVKGENKTPGSVVCDERAPLYHYKKMNRPFLLITADQDLTMRVEENKLLYSALIKKASPHSSFHCFQNRNHVSIMTKMAEEADPAFEACLKFIAQVSK